MDDRHLPSVSQPPPQADAAPPPYREADHDTSEEVARLLDQRWDLACTIPSDDTNLYLNAEGKPVWPNLAEFSKNGYRRNGFHVDLDSSPIMVKKQPYTWSCGRDTSAAELLQSQGINLLLKNFGKQLVVFERTVVVADQNRPPPKPREDKKKSLKVEQKSPGVWCITGTDIYQVEGDADDLVIRSPRFLRLWDMARGRFRWEIYLQGGHVFGLSDKYIVWKAGRYHLLNRTSGYEHGDFDLPYLPAITSKDSRDHFGPVVSRAGLILYKPGKKALYIFHVDDRAVHLRAWESEDEISGSLLLRGNLENLELELVGKNSTWIKHEFLEQVYLLNPIQKYLIK